MQEIDFVLNHKSNVIRLGFMEMKAIFHWRTMSRRSLLVLYFYCRKWELVGSVVLILQVQMMYS